MKKLVVLLLILVVVPFGASEFEAEADMPPLNVLFPEEQYIYNLHLENNENESLEIETEVQGEIIGITSLESNILLEDEESIPIHFDVPDREDEFYSGTIQVSSSQTTKNIPVALRVTDRENVDIDADITTTSSAVRPGDRIGVITILTGRSEEQTVNITYELRSAQEGELIENITQEVSFTNAESFRHDINPLGDLPIGDYYIQAHIEDEGQLLTTTTTLEVTDPFWTSVRIRIALFLLIGGIIMGGGLYAQRWYRNKKNEDARYVFPVDYKKLPNGEDLFNVGKVAETEKEASIDPDDLTTHAIVSGSTGSGKSVTASVVAEEALENDVPVVVFDPTAQWTGFVKELQDQNLLEHYPRFNLDKTQDPHPYRGIIKEIDSSDPEINFEDLKNEGEITVFTLNQLTTEEFDQAVRKIIDQIFEKDWEESPELEMLIVFDEVHRLLEEYGGQGGYKALEKGAREFRKWGIGIMMCSQVTADFKQAISGNIMTEIQMQTKSMEDIKRVEKKYGEQFSKRISSEDVGTGMIQNSNYNDGDPWFVDFRPTYHNPHKIPDKELKKYHKLSQDLDELKQKIQEKEDTKDKELELQLAENKLKEGRFKMAKMYINSLKDEMNMS